MNEVRPEVVEALETAQRLVPTPSQTAGPFLSLAMAWFADACTVQLEAPEAVTVAGQVFDGAGMPVTDAVLEFWQADAEGRYPPDTEPGWTGFTRSLTDHEGCYRLRTVKPGAVAAGDGSPQAPHVNVSLFARGLLQRLVTRIYFSDEAVANALDPVLASIGEPTIASSLIANAGPGGYRLDFRLQGDQETVFFVP